MGRKPERHPFRSEARPARAAALGWTVALALGATQAVPQAADDLPGADFYLDVSSGLVVSDNYDRIVNPSGTTTFLRNSAELGYASVTRRQSLSFVAGANFDVGEFPDDTTGQDDGLNNPFARFNYRRATSDDLLGFSASFRESFVSRAVRFDEDFAGDNTDLVEDTGTRRDAQARLQLELGRAAPIGFSGDLRYQGRRFFDVTDADLDDEDFYAADGALNFRLNGSTRLILGSTFRQRDRENLIETDTTLGLGLEYRTRGGLSVNGRAAVARNVDEQTNAAGDSVTDEDIRPIFAFGVQRALPDGALRFDYDQVLTDAGLRSEATVGRTRQLPTGTLSWRLGISANDFEGPNGVGQLNLLRETPQGVFRFGLTQQVLTDTDDGDVVRSDLRLGWERELTRLSSVTLNMGLSRSEALEEDEPDRSRGSVELAYRYRISPDWSLNTGYRYIATTRSDEKGIYTNEVFANVGRRFSLRP